VQTTYTNPIRTTNMAGLFTALERPVIVPLLHLTIWFSPLVWLSNWMSYLNGPALLSTKSSGFAGTETWEKLNFVARFQLQASPAVLARGMFGMLRYDATAALKAINVPALVLAGNRDPVCRPEASERMQGDIPGAQIAQLAPAKHMGLLEHHTQFAKIVREFSSSCLQPNSPLSWSDVDWIQPKAKVAQNLWTLSLKCSRGAEGTPCPTIAANSRINSWYRSSIPLNAFMFFVNPMKGEDPSGEALIVKLKRFVEDSDLSLYQIASLIGTSGTILSMWLAGTARPHMTELAEIEKLLKRDHSSNVSV
jgi:hypothetical protein